MYGYIYKTTNKVNGKIYIGLHRKTSFDNNYIGSGGLHFQNALKKYGRENFECFALQWCWNEKELNEAEKKYIAYFKSNNSDIGYNKTTGGSSELLSFESTRKKMSAALKGKKHSEETKAKISASHKGKNTWTKGRKHSESTLKKMSETRRGMKRTDETKAKMSAAQKGRKLSDEHRAKLSAAHKGIKHTAEAKAKMSASHKGKKMSPESVAKRTATWKANRERRLNNDSQ